MNPSSRGPRKPAVTLSKVPSVRELCERLGFQRASLKDTNAFMDASHAWRKSYKTSNGTPGTELLLWNELWVQLDLTIMAERFLEDNGNGDRFWSATRSWNHDSDVQYPADRPRIIELLKQLFWKQNRYAANNNAYAHKGVDSRDGSRENTTPMHQMVEMDGKILPVPHSNAGPNFQHQASDGVASAIENPGQGESRPAQPTTELHVTEILGEVLRPMNEKDIYEVSDDDNDSINVEGKVPKSPAQSSRPVKPKRTATSRDTTPRKKAKFSLNESRRRTDRKRVPPDRPGIVPFVSDDLYEEIMKTPPPTTRDPPLGPGVNDHSWDLSDEQNGKLGEPLAQAPGLGRPFAAPMAPMGILHSSDPISISSGSPGPMGPSRSASNSQANPSNPSNQPSKAVRIRTKGTKAQSLRTPQIPLPDTSVVSTVRAIEPSEVRQTTPTERVSIRLTVSKKDKGLPTDSNSSNLNFPFTPEDLFSKSGVSSADPPPADEENISTSATRPTSGRQTENQEASKAMATEIRTNRVPEDRSRPLQVHQGGRSSSVENGPSKARSKTQVPLWIITREPRYTEERWLEGKFQGAQLSEFLEDVSKATQRDHIEKLKLTLQTPTFDTKITVFRGDEDEWASAKKTFVEKLKEAMIKAKSRRPNEPAGFKILIEPFYEESSLKTSNADEDDVEFDF